MRRARCPRIVARAGLLVLTAGATGCTHYHIYTQPMPVAVGGAPAVVQYGAVCDVPPSSGSTPVVVAAPSRSPVLVSQPQVSPGSRFAWRRPDPESLTTTRVEGGIDETRIR